MKKIVKISIFVVLIIIVVISSFYFFMRQGNDDTVFFNLYFKTTTDIEENITVVIQKNGIELFNQTLNSSKGKSIFNEEVKYGNYDIFVYWKNQTAQYNFSPQGYNSLSLSIKGDNIYLKEATE